MTGIGADLQRVDGIDKVTGRPIFGTDRILPGMAHAVPVVATAVGGSGSIGPVRAAARRRVMTCSGATMRRITSEPTSAAAPLTRSTAKITVARRRKRS